MASAENTDLLFVMAMCFLCFIGDVSSYKTGAPFSTCLTRYPKHSHTMTKSSDPPYYITLTPKVYTPNADITVTIQSSGTNSFVGFEMGGFRQSGNPLEIVGSFCGIPENTKSFTCVGGFKNMVTHSNNTDRPNVTFSWRAPANNVGDIIFRATVVQDYEIFWINVKSEPLTFNGAVTENVTDPLFQYVPAQQGKETDFSNCGDSKACFLYPRHCQDNDCVAAVSFEYRKDANNYLVEMYADVDSNLGYVGVGFSTDKKMGKDETFLCAAFADQMSVQHGFNPAYYNERLIESFMSEAYVKHEDGRLQCGFVLESKSSVTRVDHKAAASISCNNLTDLKLTDLDITNVEEFDKEDAWHLQLAWGMVMADSNVITLHKEMPATTSSKVQIKEAGVYRGSAFHVMVQAHAALMIVAWTLLSGIVTVIARHYKDMMPRKRVLDTKVWFQLHRALAILVAVMTIIGVIIIFSHYGSKIRKQAETHAYVGLAVLVAVGLQIIAGMLRPGGEHKLRFVFNWGHRLLGQASHILAAVTMFLAFDIDYITGDMRSFGFITLGIWLGVQIMWHIFFEIVSYILRNSEADTYELDDNKGKSGKESWIPAVLLTIYIVFLTACCISVLCAFLLF